MKSNALNSMFLAAVVIIGFAAIFGLSGFLEKAKPPLPAGYADRDLALEGGRLKGFALGFEGLLADWYWMQSLQYIGGKIVANADKNVRVDDLQALNPRLLYPYLDAAATLDPRFVQIYAYGATVLPAINAQLAIRLAEKGVENNPDNWRLYHHLGYIYWKLEQFDKAAAVYDAGAEKPGAPDWMKLMSAKVRSDGGGRETARLIYRQMFDEAGEPQTREAAGLRLLQLDALDEQDAIRAALRTFKEKTGRCPNAWREISAFLRQSKTSTGRPLRFDPSLSAPLDPTGIPYRLENRSGGCDVSVDFDKSPLPLE